MNEVRERLYNLLPAIYRRRDQDQDEALRALLSVIERELVRVEDDIGGLYGDWFIETCAEWVVPYIGDLLGVRNLHSVASAQIDSQRAYVANTLRYRRRKGTAPVLEQLARDITGWPARAVEFFERLTTNQHMNHVRLHSLATVDLRQANALALLNGPFEQAAHSAEMRHIGSGRGRYNIPNLGLFLWRLQSYFVTHAQPSVAPEANAGCYRFSPLGNDIPLFNRSQTETTISHLAEEINVPGQLRRRALYDDLEAYRLALTQGKSATTRFFGSQPVLQLFLDNAEEPLAAAEIVICNLDGWDEASWSPPARSTVTDPDGHTLYETKVAVDPELGRLAILDGVVLPTSITVNYAYGFPSDMGGGPYNRQATLVQPGAALWSANVRHATTATGYYGSIGAALAAWQASTAEEGVITVTDSATYRETLTITMAAGRSLTIQAADKERPLLCLLDPGDVEGGELGIDGGDGEDTSLTLNGFWIQGGLHVAARSLECLAIVHCSLVPGRNLNTNSQPQRPDLPSITVESPNSQLQVTVDHSIIGPVYMAETCKGFAAHDSLIQSPLRGGPAKHTPALVSGSLSTFPPLAAPTPTIHVQIGNEGPIAVTLAVVPTTLAAARDALETALRAAHTSRAFAAARVISAANRLIILPGTPEPVTVTAAEADPTAVELRFSDGSAYAPLALLSPDLTMFPLLSAPLAGTAPQLAVTIGSHGSHTVVLAPAPTTMAQARDRLHSTIRGADIEPAFHDAIVGSVDGRLVLLPGIENATIRFGTTADDNTTLTELGLHGDRYAVAANHIGFQPGPQALFERTTILGAVYSSELDLASESIFVNPLRVQRRQTGCTRFSYLAPGSQAPRRFRCQPDLALEQYARSVGKASAADLSVAERAGVAARLTPTFTSTQYGNPAYGQLSRKCAEEIRTGAEDGSAMGVYSELKAPQREANLRAALDEYLRFGLQAGIFYVT